TSTTSTRSARCRRTWSSGRSVRAFRSSRTRTSSGRSTRSSSWCCWPQTGLAKLCRYPPGMPSNEDVVEALRQVEDPELGMDIVELGLFYGAEIDGENVKVTYSLTSMGCPAGPMIQEDIERVLYEIPGIGTVESELTFDPPWTPDRMSDDAKFILGFG